MGGAANQGAIPANGQGAQAIRPYPGMNDQPQFTTGQGMPQMALGDPMSSTYQDSLGPARTDGQGGLAPGYSEQARQMMMAGDQQGAMELLRRGTGMPAQQEQQLREGQPAFQTLPAQQPQQQFQQGQNVFDQSANAYTNALNTAQQGTNFQAPQGQAAQMQAALMGSTGYDASNAASQGYNTALANAQGYGAREISGPGAITADQVGGQNYQAALANSQGYNAAQAAAQGYDAERAAGVRDIRELDVTAGQVGDTDLSRYQNQYDTGVIDLAMGDIERNRQIQQTNDAAKATAANAFGGSRQGIAEAETNRAFAEQAAKTATGLRQQGFTNAQALAQADIDRRMQAGMANQGANLQAQTNTAANSLQQQLANMAAGNQASQFGAQALNNAALQNASMTNQASQFGAQAANTAGLANQAALNSQRRYGADSAMQAALANQSANLQAATTSAANSLQSQLANQSAVNRAGEFGAAANNNVSLANQSAQNAQRSLAAQAANTAALQNANLNSAASQFGAQAANTAAANNQGALNNASGMNMGAQNAMTNTNLGNMMMAQNMRQNAGAQLGALGQQGFNMGRTLQQDQYNQGLLQQGMNQSLIDAAKGQYSNFVNAPYNSLQYPMAAITGSPQPSTTTRTQNPGLFNYLSLPFMYGAM